VPSTSKKQADFMRAVAKSPKFAKQVKVPQSVGEDFMKADKKTKRFAAGGPTNAFTQDQPPVGDVRMASPMPMQQQNQQDAPTVAPMTTPVDQTQTGTGTAATNYGIGLKKGGKVKAKPTKTYKAGGSVKSSASRRGDGCAVKGKTRGRMV
jgi:hypothetical protein